MTDLEQQLLKLLVKRSFRRGNFKLASGDTSDYYIDGKMTQVCSQGAALLGEILYERTKDLQFDAIGGLEVGAVPLVTAAVIAYHLHDRELEGFWVRDEAKQHGTKKIIEGNVPPGGRVVILDDVVTRGESAAKAIRAVQKQQCEVIQVITIVDRRGGAGDVFRDLGVPEYRPIFTIDDLFYAEADVARPPQTAAR
jgi:orotate phosphoribosyltransferase